MIIEIHCSPKPAGTDDVQYAYIEAAIAEAQGSGLRYEVGALGTTVEGTPDALWSLLRRMHEATLKSGADSTMTNIRIAEHASNDGPHMDSLVAKFRNNR